MALVLSGCGGQTTEQAKACAALENLPSGIDAGNAVTSLRQVLAAELEALAHLSQLGEFRAALSEARRNATLALNSVMVDPLRSGTMSPTATIAPAARRAVALARSAREEYC